MQDARTVYPASQVRLFSILVWLAGTLQRDLVLRNFAAFQNWRCLRLGIWLGLRRRLYNLPGINWMYAGDWRDHGGLLWGKIGAKQEDFTLNS